MKKLVGRALVFLSVGVTLIIAVSAVSLSLEKHLAKGGKIVSYEYTKPCKECGQPLEGYHSFKDGYTREYCSNCGYYWEGEER